MDKSTEMGRVAQETLNRIAESNYIPTEKVRWYDIDITVRKSLTISQMLEFVKSVVEVCFNADTGAYRPEVKAFAIRCAILEYYAGFELPVSVVERYDLVYHLGYEVLKKVTDCVDQMQLRAMLEAIDEKIEHQAMSNIEAVTVQMNTLIAGLSNLEDRVAGLFRGVDQDTVAQIAKAFAGGGFDEDKLVKAVISAGNQELAARELAHAETEKQA